MTTSNVAAIDWSSHDQYSENTCTCRDCDTEFRSHSKFAMASGGLVSRKPCPQCGGHALRRSSSDVETMTLKGKP